MEGARSDPGTDSEAFVSWREFLTSSYAPSLLLVCLAVWLHAADGLIVATMLPSIVIDIGGAALVGWSVSLYEIGSIVGGAASALLTIRYGLRGPMSFASALFGVGCLLAAIGPSMPVVLAARLLQGVGGGSLVAMGFVAVGVIFPRRYIARALAAVSTLWGLSAFMGPLIGGLFVEYATWRWGFVFFGAQAFVLALWIVFRPEPAGQAGKDASPFPWRRLGLLCLAVTLVSSGGVVDSSALTAWFVLAGLACLAGFLRIDARAEASRMLPRQPFDIRQRSGAALLMIFSFAVASIVMGAFGPLLMTAIYGVSALSIGYLLAGTSIGWTVVAVLVSGSPERLDRRLIGMGMVLVLISIVGFVYAVPQGPIWLVAVFAVIQGCGFGMAWTFILRRATENAPAGELQRISGAIPTVQRLGYALGAAYFGIVANASGLLTMQTPAEAADVARLVFAASVPFALIGVVALVGLVRGGKNVSPT